MSEQKQARTREEVDALPAGQWAITADGSAICLMDTHIGWPQRMWGRKANGREAGRITHFSALDSIQLPIDLADIVWTDGYECEHPDTNECGQCLNCGAPEVGEHREMHMDEATTDLIRAVVRRTGPVTAGVQSAPVEGGQE